ncbi:helix-turn-helix domain-containing protein [Streptomyces sp. NPDC087300]|uniref:helix-turn-helix domain-containing protein n=1 Tax=Streptomyces sp. NPDC087300 TaxID=3365780 RepID=UPI003814BBDD
MPPEPHSIVRLARPITGPGVTRTAASIMLGVMVSTARDSAGWTQKFLAGRAHVSTPTVCRLETAEAKVEPRTVEQIIQVLPIDASERETMIVLLERSTEPEWFQQRFADVTPDYLQRLLGMESMAVHLVTYDVRLVCGLLQTHQYTEAVIRTGLHLNEQNGDELELRLQQRLERQRRVLDQPDPPQCTFLMDESVLRRRVGPDDVMREQMQFLREAADRPRVSIRFVPLDRPLAGNEASMAGSMAELKFGRGGLPDFIYTEGYLKADYLSKPVQTARDRTQKIMEFERHQQLLLRLQGEACASLTESRKLLDDAIRWFR